MGGMTMGADPVACAALAGGAEAKAFFVRKDAKAHGLQRRIEGPPLGPEDRCVVVEDVVTTGGSTLAAIAALQEAGLEICGVISVLDRLAGGGAAIEREAGRAVRGAEHDRRGLSGSPRPNERLIAIAAREAATLTVRPAHPEDVPLLLELFGELAEYEHLEHELKATEEQLREALFGERPAAEALIAERDGEALGYALFFPTFSSFLASTGRVAGGPVRAPGAPRRGRRQGAARGGRGAACASAAASAWNGRRSTGTSSALGFYRRIGAATMNEWITHRLDGEALERAPAGRRDDASRGSPGRGAPVAFPTGLDDPEGPRPRSPMDKTTAS